MMKKLYVCILLTVLLVFFAVLSSCGESNMDEICVTASNHGCWDGETYYYLSQPWPNRIMYQRMDNVQSAGLPLYDDLLAEGAEDPFKNVDVIRCFLVDPTETEKNGGAPVLLIAAKLYIPSGEPGVVGKNYSRIFYYNTKTHRATVINDEIPNTVEQMILYGDAIYYTTDDGDKGQIVHKIKTDGSDHSTMETSEKHYFTLMDIYDGTLILYEIATKTVYTCSDELMDLEPLTNEASNLYHMEVYDGYLYYHAYSKIVDGVVTCFEIRRIHLSGEKESELIMEDVGFGRFADGVFYYFPYTGQVNLSDFHTLYAYDLNTGEERMIFNTSRKAVFQYCTEISDRYMMCSVQELTTGKTYMSCVDLETLEETKVPY